jgi:hypothetical protein
MKKDEELNKIEVKRGNQYIEPYTQIGPSKKEQIIELRSTTFKNNTQIAKIVDCHRSYVTKVLGELPLEQVDQERVSYIKSYLLDVLKDKIDHFKDQDDVASFKALVMGAKTVGKFLGIEAPQQIQVTRDQGPQTVNVQINVKSREEAQEVVKEIDAKSVQINDEDTK